MYLTLLNDTATAVRNACAPSRIHVVSYMAFPIVMKIELLMLLVAVAQLPNPRYSGVIALMKCLSSCTESVLPHSGSDSDSGSEWQILKGVIQWEKVISERPQPGKILRKKKQPRRVKTCNRKRGCIIAVVRVRVSFA